MTCLLCYDVSESMKIDRLIGILSVLLQSKQTTAPELAELFEVSRRTINRDIETLCKAGIPIMTLQGSGGGIAIMDGFRVDRTILSSKDMRMIMAGLRSLDSISGSSYYTQLMEKLELGSSQFISGKDSLLIDLTSWYGKSLTPKLEIVQSAIENRHLLTFGYYSPSGDSKRNIEPYYLIFRWSSWYVWGWCQKRKDYRLFKLNRMQELKESEKNFVCREAAMPDLSDENVFKGEPFTVKIIFDRDVKWRLIEEFGMDCFKEEKDGRLLFEHEYNDMDSLISWLLTFEDKAELLEPKKARIKMKQLSEKMSVIYREESDK